MATTAGMTLEDFLALPDTKPGSEFIDGEVVQKSMPTLAHAIIQGLLSIAVGLYLRDHPIGIAGTELRCIFGPPNRFGRLPDFVFVSHARLTGQRADRPLYGAPDLAVEVLSPDDRMMAVMEKLHFYLEHGVRLVWLINPAQRTLTIMDSPFRPRVLMEHDVVDGGDVLPGFSVPVRELLPRPDELPG